MALFSKPLHTRVLAHPAMGWAMIGMVAVSAAELVGRAVVGTAQLLRREAEEPAPEPRKRKAR